MKLTKNILSQIIGEVIFEADDDDKYTHIGYGKYKEKGKEKDPKAPTFKKTDSGKYVPVKGDKGGEEEKPKKLTKISADPFAKDDEPFDSGGPSYANVPKGAKTSKQAKDMKSKEKPSGEKPSGEKPSGEKSKDEKKAKHDDLFKQGLNASGNADYNKVHDVVKSMKSEEEKDEYLGYLKKEHKRREVVSKKVEKKLDIVSAKIDELEDKMQDAEDKSDAASRAGDDDGRSKYIKLRDEYDNQILELEEQRSKLWEYQEENDPDTIDSTVDSVNRQSETRDQQQQWKLNKSTQSHPEEIRAVTGTPPHELGRDKHDAILAKVDKAIEHAKKNGASEESISSLKAGREELHSALRHHKASASSGTSKWNGTYPIMNPMVTASIRMIQSELLGTDNPDYDAKEEEEYYDEGKTTTQPWNQKKEESITSKLKREFKEYEVFNKNLRRL